MHQKPGGVTLACVLLAVLATTATADPGTGPQNDAGTGADAGDVRANATKVGIGILYGAALRPNDVDWYASSIEGGAASCVVARVHASASTYFALGAEEGGASRSAVFRTDPNEEDVAGVAGMTPLTTTLRAALVPGGPNFAGYDFRLDRVGAPVSGGDAGTEGDAGDAASTALAAARGCTQGRLTVLGSLDLRDTYSMQVGSNEVVTYSLAANAEGISLTLLNAVGEAVGPALMPGELATVSTSAPGTYYLSAARTSAVGDVGYVFGTSLGPEPSGCRPYCLGV